MSDTDRFSIKEVAVVVILLAVVGGAMYFTLRQFNSEGTNKSVEISSLGDAEDDRIEAVVKILAIDPIKGEVTARFEFAPTGTLVASDETLNQDVKVYINSSNAKQETEYSKGKRMAPVEGVFNLYDGSVTEYPFDKYLTEIDLYIVRSAPASKPKPQPSPIPAEEEGDQPAAVETKSDEEDSNDIALTMDFEGSIPGYSITAAKAKYTDESYVGIETRIERANTVKFFSMFVSGLMWVLSIGVLFMLASVLVRGRKVELGMFSFMATLLFAFYAVRNSQPNVPPIGVFSDFMSFFWVEAIVATCLVVGLTTWLFRSTK